MKRKRTKRIFCIIGKTHQGFAVVKGCYSTKPKAQDAQRRLAAFHSDAWTFTLSASLLNPKKDRRDKFTRRGGPYDKPHFVGG